MRGECKYCCYKDLIFGAVFIVTFIQLEELPGLVLNSIKNMFQLVSFSAKTMHTMLTLFYTK